MQVIPNPANVDQRMFWEIIMLETMMNYLGLKNTCTCYLTTIQTQSEREI
jgi:hypothetical protein